jgi:hypothetical protein
MRIRRLVLGLAFTLSFFWAAAPAMAKNAQVLVQGTPMVGGANGMFFDANCENLLRLSFFAVAGTRADELARERRTPFCALGL